MYSFLLESRVLPDKDYEFFTYHRAKKVDVSLRGKPITISKGTRFGVRPSTNGKSIRLIFPDEATKVITIDLETAKKLAKGIK